MAQEKLLKDSVENILSMDAKLFPVFKDQDIVRLDLFTVEDVFAIKAKIREYQLDPRSRSGGSYLLKELQYVYSAKEGLDNHLNNIRVELQPKEITRTTIAQAQEQQIVVNVSNVQHSLAALGEKTLRVVGESLIGDKHLDYTATELPYALAYFQIHKTLPHE